MTKIAAMPIFLKYLLKIDIHAVSETRGPYKICLNDDPGLNILLHGKVKCSLYVLFGKRLNSRLYRFKPPSILILTVPSRYFCCGFLL